MIPRPVNQRGLASSEGNIAEPFHYEDLPLEVAGKFSHLSFYLLKELGLNRCW